MIIASLLLILVAVALLVLGLVDGSSVLLISSITTSLVAAVALVVGARQAVAARAGNEPKQPGGRSPQILRGRGASRGRFLGENATTGSGAAGSMPSGRPGDVVIPAQLSHESPWPPDGFPDRLRTYGGISPGDLADVGPADVGGDPSPGEPAAESVRPEQVARVAQLTAEVLVVDGQPRYHLSECPHLTGRDTMPLPVGEAVELGFTPCAWCEPVSALLLDVRHG